MSDSSSAYQPSAAYDVVAVFDNNFNQIFSSGSGNGARPIKARIVEKAKVLKHPIETGASIVDFRIIEPIEITLDMTLNAADYVATYNEIKQVFLGNSTIQVQTKTGLYPNMLIAEMPHDEDANYFDTIAIPLRLTEAQFVIASTSPLPASMTTKNNGNVTGKPATTAQENNASAVAGPSALDSIFYSGK